MTTNLEYGPTFDRAMSASADGNSEQAIELFREAMKEQPEFALPAFLLGAEFAQLGRIEEAVQAYASAVVLAPELHIARYQLGLLQLTSGHVALALLTWQPLVQLPETEPLRAFVMGFTAMAGDKFDEALAYFRAGQSLNQSNEPLNRDIEMVIGKIQALGTNMSEGSAQGAAPGGEEEAADANSSHVLLSNYGNGSIH